MIFDPKLNVKVFSKLLSVNANCLQVAVVCAGQ